VAPSPVVDMTVQATDGAAARRPTDRHPRPRRGPWDMLSPMTSVRFGDEVAGDDEYRLCGDVQGKRVIELGVAATGAAPPNSVVLARAGAKAIAVDPSPDVISVLRRAAEGAEVRVECHVGELADLGFATSGSVDLVLASRTVDDVDDLPRLLRQVHRVLRPGASFVLAGTHPVAAMFDPGQPVPVRRYGSPAARSISELFMGFERSNFRIDVVHEVPPLADPRALVPAVLLVRARKQGV